MNLHEYNTMCEIVNEIDFVNDASDVGTVVTFDSAIEGFVYDCQMLGANQTAKYVYHNPCVDKKMVMMLLASDFSGC